MIDDYESMVSVQGSEYLT